MTVPRFEYVFSHNEAILRIYTFILLHAVPHPLLYKSVNKFYPVGIFIIVEVAICILKKKLQWYLISGGII